MEDHEKINIQAEVAWMNSFFATQGLHLAPAGTGWELTGYQESPIPLDYWGVLTLQEIFGEYDDPWGAVAEYLRSLGEAREEIRAEEEARNGK